MYTLTVANHKGGVGKTSTALALAQGLELAGKHTLLIDFDPQANLTFSCVNMDCRMTIQDLLQPSNDILPMTPNVCKFRTFTLDVIASINELSAHENELKPSTLADTLTRFQDDYDYCVIDAPPSLNLLTINALTASSGVIIPVMCDAYSIQAVNQLSETIHSVQSSSNPFLNVTGILFNFYNPLTNLGKQSEPVFQQLADSLNTTIFETKIRRAQDIANCGTSGYSIYEYKPNSRASLMYREFVNEVIERTN